MIDRRRRVQNRILRSLPPTEYRRLTARARTVRLSGSRVLADFDRPSLYVYFPVTGMCGITLSCRSGARLQVASVGCEGVTSIYRNYLKTPDAQLHVELQPATAVQVSVEDFDREMDARLTLQSVVRKFYSAFHAEMMLSVACNRVHSLRQRYCRHLLSLTDRLASNELRITHMSIAALLGATRPSVTLASVELKRLGAISYRRNTLKILDRTTLEARACECYWTARGLLEDLLPPRI